MEEGTNTLALIGKQGKDSLKAIDENSVIIKNFKNYAAALDEKNDRYERLVKISRNITIESKRIIFLLHSIDRGKPKDLALKEAESRLKHLVEDSFCQIAKELKDEDPNRFHRAFTFGVQEFIEAYTFFHYLQDKSMHHWDVFQSLLKYTQAVEGADSGSECISTDLLPLDYILGLADLTGELMRRCINNLGIGDIQGCFDTCDVVKKLYAGFLSLGSFKIKEVSHKIHVLKQSLLKMENVCYNIHVRSKEKNLPEHILLNLASALE